MRPNSFSLLPLHAASRGPVRGYGDPSFHQGMFDP